MGALDLLVRSIKSKKYGRPFYSKLDEALENLPRQKGTAEEFMKELEKQPGVKKAEIEDRGVRRALANRARSPGSEKPITKEQMKELVHGQAPMPPLIEDVLGGRDTLFDDYRTLGGENYREILLRLPEDYYGDSYVSPHFEEHPKLLAHIRVSDFKTPDGKKVLLVDEVQSDWHQTGRKGGYFSPYASRNLEVDRRLYEYAQEDKAKAKDAMEAAQAAGDNAAYEANRDKYLELVQRSMTLDSRIAKQKQEIERGAPDAPFKKNWHELAMKRVLDYAVEEGYDTVAITPGAEQAKRYDLSKQISKIDYDKFNSGQNEFKAWDKNGKKVFEKYGASQEEVADYIGKEAAEKLFAATPKDNHMGGERYSLIGEDLQVGGEGMKGFYDKILPDYLNNYGKQYGASVEMRAIPLSKMVDVNDFLSPTETAEIADFNSKAFHAFNITPQMREEIKTKGQPLYSKIGVPGAEATAGAGAATIGSQMFDENNEQGVQNPVHFTENPDAMLLELMQRN